ncbi:MAG: zinc-dependent metalloprotease [Ignavibacteria bacterium]|nr:zinc-dependent metalloprotease [Ignavibacteria bacterium]
MKKLTILALMLIFGLVPVCSQTNIYNPFSINYAKTSLAAGELSKSVDDAEIVDVDFNLINKIIDNNSENITLSIPHNGSNLVIKLNRFDILDDNIKIVEGTASGDKQITSKKEFASYTGNLYDINSPLVAVTFFRNDVSALVIYNNETYVLAKQQSTGDFISYKSSKLKIQNNFKCNTDELGIPSQITELQKSLSGNFSSSQTSTLLKASIATESDYEFYTGLGNSTEKATNYIIALYVPVSAIYMRDVNVMLQLTYMRVWTTSADPYPDATSSNTLLNSFRSYWNANMQSTQRTLAHFISTRPGGLGGIAWVNVLCATGPNHNGYAFSDIDANFNPLPTYSWDCMVVAHETGHNFGSPHTHSCSWPGGPIDSCYETEGGCYTGPAIARVGTIMSYCHLNGSIALYFGALPSQLIRSRSEAAACMNSVSGYAIGYPNGGSFYRSGTTVPVIWGTSNLGNVDLQYTTNNGTNWVNIGTNIDAVLRTYNWTIPYIPTTTQAKVRVFQSGNTSTADESDSTFQLRPTITAFTLLNPPQLSRINVSTGDTSKVHFSFTKGGSLPEFKYKWTLSTTNNSNSYSTFSNSSGTDSVLSISKNTLDSIVASWGVNNVGDSIRVRWSVKCFTQFDSLAANTNFLVTIARTVIGIEPISSVIPDKFYVNPNYPNPFNPETKIKFGLPANADVKISVYDMLGREVDILVNSKLEAGEYIANWNAVNFSSGIYIYRIEAKDVKGNKFIETRKMVLVK